MGFNNMNKEKQIVCISTHYWDDPWFRKQHFMSRFVEKGYKVAYIEPSFSIAKKPDKDKSIYQTNKLFTVTVEKRQENLFIIKPPQGIPFWSNPMVSKLNYIYFAFQLNRALKKLEFNDYILWNYRPEYAFALNIFKCIKTVFDLTDDLAAYRGNKNKKYDYIKKCTDKLTHNSDLLIVTASTLYEMYKHHAKNIVLIPNGFDSSLFAAGITKVPDDIKNLRTPIVGFIGTLFHFLDYELIEFLVQNNPDKSFVFIGSCEENSRKKWMKIIEYKNVYWLGRKQKEHIPAYLKNFDVCINPFKVDDVSKSVSPLKVFEYLAMKKPVVSVKMESLEKEEVAQYIYFASSYNEFNERLNAAVLEKDSFQHKLNYDVVLKYSWDRLFEKALDCLNII